MADVRQEIRGMILNAFLGGAPDTALDDDESLDRAHIVDSVRTLELLLFVEEQFGITVENDEAVPENFDTVSNIVAFIERKRSV
jgi:acyl carrier protein